MDELEIPERARDLVLRAAWPVTDPTPERVTDALHAAAEIIVAAELRRLLIDELALHLWVLQKRADELDPPGDETQWATRAEHLLRQTH